MVLSSTTVVEARAKLVDVRTGATLWKGTAQAAELFGDLGRSQACDLPNTLYKLYETQFGITIHRAEEQLRAVAATDHDASLLGLAEGTPLLEIERTALTLDGIPVELRISRCNTSKHHYQNTVL